MSSLKHHKDYHAAKSVESNSYKHQLIQLSAVCLYDADLWMEIMSDSTSKVRSAATLVCVIELVGYHLVSSV